MLFRSSCGRSDRKHGHHLSGCGGSSCPLLLTCHLGPHLKRLTPRVPRQYSTFLWLSQILKLSHFQTLKRRSDSSSLPAVETETSGR